MLKAYNDLLTEKGWTQDPVQYDIALLLDKLQQELTHNNRALGAGLHKIRRYLNLQAPLSTAGIYLWGGVGRGKTMLMDLFYESVLGVEKRRYHFHHFMSQFHAALHQANTAKDKIEPMLIALNAVIGNASLLCLDELQVNNIADAMVMGRVFASLLKQGVLIVITSNRHPSELFKDGLQRERFLPFVDLVLEKFTVISMDESQDYRAQKAYSLDRVYYYPLGPESQEFLHKAQQQLIGWHPWAERRIKVSENRSLLVLRSHRYMAKFSFAELCIMPLGAADYMEICHHFSTIIIEGIPQMHAESHNEALRFITLIDCLYNSKTKLICTADVPYDRLYTGRTNRFEFDRTISRLREMQTAEYLHSEKE